MTDLLHDIMASSDQRWRYPATIGLLSDPVRPSPDLQLAQAVALDLAKPPDTAETAAEQLIGDGDFAAADELISGASLGDQLDEALRKARESALRDVDRRHNELLERSKRCEGEAVERRRLASLCHTRRAASETALADWQERIEETEQNYALQLEERLLAVAGTSTPVWVEAVLTCIKAREFPAANMMLDGPPDAGTPGGPLGVPYGQERWPWPHLGLTDILAWYENPDAEPPPDFVNRWRPDPRTDPVGSRLVRALQEMCGELSLSTVQTFADALDELLGFESTRHTAEETESGIRTTINGLQDPRFTRIAIPASWALLVGSSGPPPENDDPSQVTVWLELTPSEAAAPLPRGVVRMLPELLYRLLARGAGAGPMSTSERRINLLRALCRQLPLQQLFPEQGGIQPTSAHELRDDMAWLLDLLGVRARGAVVDALCYDTAGYRPAIIAALESLLAGGGNRPRELTMTDIAEWRRSREALVDFRGRVFQALMSELDVAAVSLAALALQDNEPDRRFGENEVREWLGIFAGDGSEPVTAVLPDFESSLRRAVSAGILRHSGEQYGFRGPGLAAMLGDDVEGYVEETLNELRQQHQLVLEQVNLQMRNETLSSSLHTMKTDLHELRTALKQAIGTDSLDIASSALVTGAERAAKIEKRCAELVIARGQEMLVNERVDVGELLEELRRGFESKNPARLTVTVRAPEEPLVIFASRYLVRLAIENLMTNAMQAQDGPEFAVASIGLTLTNQPIAIAGTQVDCAVIDVEDDGPGVAEHVAASINSGKVLPERPNGLGRGIDFTRAHIARFGGRLYLVGRSSAMNGAHFRVQLPLSEEPDREEVNEGERI
ncbi:ATP-binding protein [Amycolatopsis sp. CA-128772]|uniref:sensor histidine kinase n=1 Tax=Amycolatopsis sp. CA-128772 TaxID=2073159 RepID=UPI000CD16BCA|nr:ATP-binding protein [Amycolatopsis sp. CA-128772]